MDAILKVVFFFLSLIYGVTVIRPWTQPLLVVYLTMRAQVSAPTRPWSHTTCINYVQRACTHSERRGNGVFRGRHSGAAVKVARGQLTSAHRARSRCAPVTRTCPAYVRACMRVYMPLSFCHLYLDFWPRGTIRDYSHLRLHVLCMRKIFYIRRFYIGKTCESSQRSVRVAILKMRWNIYMVKWNDICWNCDSNEK